MWKWTDPRIFVFMVLKHGIRFISVRNKNKEIIRFCGALVPDRLMLQYGSVCGG